MIYNLEEVKSFCEKYFEYGIGAPCFNTRHSNTNQVTILYNKDGVEINYYSGDSDGNDDYYEVIGLTEEDYKEVFDLIDYLDSKHSRIMLEDSQDE